MTSKWLSTAQGYTLIYRQIGITSARPSLHTPLILIACRIPFLSRDKMENVVCVPYCKNKLEMGWLLLLIIFVHYKMSRREKTSRILQILRVQKYIIFGKLYESGNRENTPYNLATWLRLIQFIFLFSKHTLSAEIKLTWNLNFVKFQFRLLFYKSFNRGLHGIVLTGRQKWFLMAMSC